MLVCLFECHCDVVSFKIITKVSLATQLIYLAGTTRALCDRTVLAGLVGCLLPSLCYSCHICLAVVSCIGMPRLSRSVPILLYPCGHSLWRRAFVIAEEPTSLTSPSCRVHLKMSTWFCSLPMPCPLTSLCARWRAAIGHAMPYRSASVVSSCYA